MKALSLTQPWAWAMVHAGKQIENRSRSDGRMPDICRHRGPILLHAAKGMTLADYNSAAAFMAELGIPCPPRIQRSHEDAILARGVFVGRGMAVGHIEAGTGAFRGTWDGDLDMRWWMGGYALVIVNICPVKWVLCRGALGLWTPPAEVLAQLSGAP